MKLFKLFKTLNIDYIKKFKFEYENINNNC